jgi:type I restriction enzyme, S subunit
MTPKDEVLRVLPLRELVEFRSELVRPSDGRSGHALFVGLQHVEQHTGRKLGHDDVQLEQLLGRKFVFSTGDILYGSLRPYLNKVWIAEHDGLCSVDQFVLRPRAPLVEARFLAAYLRSYTFLAMAAGEASFVDLPRIRRDRLGSIPVPVPSPDEQRRIVGRIDAIAERIDEALVLANRVDADHVKLLEEAALREAIPVEDLWPSQWESEQLGEVVKLINGYHFRPADWSSQGRPIIRIGNLTGSDSHMNRFAGELPKKYLVKPGDILLSWSASIGAFQWVDEEAWLNQHIFKVVPKSPLIHRYLLYALMSLTRALAPQTHGTGMRHLVKHQVEESRIPIPRTDVQASIADELDAVFSRTQEIREFVRDRKARLLDIRRSAIEEFLPKITFSEDDVA